MHHHEAKFLIFNVRRANRWSVQVVQLLGLAFISDCWVSTWMKVALESSQNHIRLCMSKEFNFACKLLSYGRCLLLWPNLTYADKYTCLGHLQLPLPNTTYHLCPRDMLFPLTPVTLIFPWSFGILLLLWIQSHAYCWALMGRFVTHYYHCLFACLPLPLWQELLKDRHCARLIYCFNPSVCSGMFVKQMNEWKFCKDKKNCMIQTTAY